MKVIIEIVIVVNTHKRKEDKQSNKDSGLVGGHGCLLNCLAEVTRSS